MKKVVLMMFLLIFIAGIVQANTNSEDQVCIYYFVIQEAKWNSMSVSEWDGKIEGFLYWNFGLSYSSIRYLDQDLTCIPYPDESWNYFLTWNNGNIVLGHWLSDKAELECLPLPECFVIKVEPLSLFETSILLPLLEIEIPLSSSEAP